MKKIIAAILTLVMLLSLSAGIIQNTIVANAEAVTTKPFYILNSSRVDEGRFSNIYYMPQLYENAPTNSPEIKVSFRDTHLVSTIPEIVTQLKAVMDRRPEGTRFIQTNLPSKVIRNPEKGLIEGSIFMEKGVAVVSAWLDEFLKAYKAAGGKLDGITLDTEYVGYGFTCAKLQQAYANNPYLLKEIVEHPSYQTKLRPLLVERGFQFMSHPGELSTELYRIMTENSKDDNSKKAFEAAAQILQNQYINEMVFEPLMKYYPDAVLKDYKAVDTYAWLKDLNNNGSAVYEAGNVFTVGNRSDAIFYNVYPGAGFYHYGKEAVYPNVPGHNDAVYDADAYGMFLWDANRFKNLYTSSKGNLSAIVTYYDYAVTNKAPDRTDTSSNTPYYTETIYHVGLLDPDPFCCYVYPGDVGNGDTAAYNHRLSVLSEIANELTRLVGFSDRKPIPVPAAWNNGYVLSGMYANGRNVWRITPDTTDGMTLENFKTSDATPTFSINGQTITFPGGKIIEDSKISEVGTCGYWVETPKDVMPIVTNIADRYSQYPSFAEDFEQYQIGTKFDSTTALPEQCWEVTPSKGATAVIQAANGNNALALTGNVTIKNLKLPQNITAGDYYAKQQAWEVTFTMPKTLDAKSELILLNVVTAKDGGIKIADGKLWYDQAGKYQVMEGVSIAAGETYTVKRELDLTTESAYISDYAIYNVEGKKLGSAQNIPLCADFAVPVSVIGLSCANIISDPVLLDDYKLYPTGAAMDFELYDAKTGILVADPTTARNSDTAYRLSWMNATDKVKLANVVVEKYDTNNTLISKTVLQEVKMAPGCDGVETGIVKNETEGQTILVYLEAKNVASADSIGFIVITSIVLGVLSIVVAVAWVLVLKRKRNTAAQ